MNSESKYKRISRRYQFLPRSQECGEHEGDRKKRKTRTATKKEFNKISYEARKKLRSLQNKLSKAEAQIAALEKEIAEIDVELAINYNEVIAQPNFFDTYQQKKDKLDALMTSWEALHEEIEANSEAT